MTDQNQRGFTLIELMISLVLFSFAIAGVLAVAVSVTQGYREQRAAVAAEQAVRVPLDFLADALRQASPGVSDPTALTDYHNCQQGAVTVTNNFSTGAIAGADKLDVMYASGAVVTSLKVGFTNGQTQITVTDDSQLAAGDSVIVTDFDKGVLVTIASKGSAGVLNLNARCSGTVTTFPTAGFLPGAVVVRAQHATFYVGLDPQDSVPTLFMDPDGEAQFGGGTAVAEPLAEGIEDLQVAVGVDADGANGISEASSTTDEWHYNVAGDAAPAAGAKIRAVRLTLVARTVPKLGGNTNTVVSFSRPAVEDHAASSVLDSYRRRILRSIVEMRNIGGSP